MKILPLTAEYLPEFLAYCKQHGPEHDASFLPEEGFSPDSTNPTYIMVDSANQLKGAVSLMLDTAFRAARKGRFRIFHTLTMSSADYQALLEAVKPHLEGIDNIYLFIPEIKRSTTGQIFEELGFKIERYSWVLSRPVAGVPEPAFPAGFTVQPLKPGVDDQAWCDIINEAFAHLQGHLHATPEKLHQLLAEKESLPGGLMLLWHGEKPVGTVRVLRAENNGELEAEIAGLGVVSDYRGQGLGVNLLRAGVAFGRKHGLEKTSLSVNAENENAAQLYLQEGYEKELVVVCYNLRV